MVGYLILLKLLQSFQLLNIVNRGVRDLGGLGVVLEAVFGGLWSEGGVRRLGLLLEASLGLAGGAVAAGIGGVDDLLLVEAEAQVHILLVQHLGDLALLQGGRQSKYWFSTDK